MVWRSAINGILFIAVAAIVMGFTLDSSFAKGIEENPIDMVCRGGEIPCTKRCGPVLLNSYTAKGLNIAVMGERSEINLLAGKSTEYVAQCQPGFVAVGGGYKIIEEGTTIDLNEIKINGNWAENNPHTHWNGWKVWVYRDNSGAPNNCLSLEVHTTCVQAQ